MVESSTSVSVTSSRKDEHLKKEFDKLNIEVNKLLDEIRKRERYALTIIAVVAAWLFKEVLMISTPNNNPLPSTNLIVLVSSILFLIILLYGLSVLLLYKNVKWIGTYLKEIENYFLDKPKSDEKFEFGWESYFEKENRKKLFVILTYAYWFFYLLLSLALIVIIYQRK